MYSYLGEQAYLRVVAALGEKPLKSEILRSLYEDHANQLQLLRLIEQEINKLEKAGETPNFELISLALEYCADYPSHYHHPKEDLIYDKLVSRNSEVANKAVGLTEEHKTLTQLTRVFATAVGEAIAGTQTDKLRTSAEELIQYYRRHIGIEEAEIFPAARDTLTNEDWVEISTAFENISDPLFGEQSRQSYLALRRCIVERAEEESL